MTKGSKKRQDSIPTEWTRWDSSWPGLAEADDRNALFDYMAERFGIPAAAFDNYLLFKKQKSWWLLRRSSALAAASQLKVTSVGLRAFQRVGAYVKPTTRMIQIFGKWATRARIELDREQLRTLLDGQVVSQEMNMENGYVILCLHGQILGLGLYVNGRMHSQIPHKDLQSFPQTDSGPDSLPNDQ